MTDLHGRSAPVTLLDQGSGATPDGGDTRPLALVEPRKNIGTLPWPSVAERLHEAARARWTPLVHRERVATLAIRVHSSLAPPSREVQPIVGSMTEAHRSKPFALRI